MSSVPESPKIYHITHVDNLLRIQEQGGLLADSAMIARDGPPAPIGMPTIKERRLTLPVKCHPGDCVGDYVPFYFCPRSIMLYLLYMGNHPELKYRGGQSPIIHLEADLDHVVEWADEENRRWAFSLSNAGARYAEFRSAIEQLDEINWTAVAATDFRDGFVKEGKQAEFLVHEHFPWHLVERIGVRSPAIRARVSEALGGSAHRPVVSTVPDWYF